MSRAVVLTILAVVLAGLIGAGAYQAGIAQGVAQVATSGQVVAPVAAPYYYGHPGGFGFGFFGILVPILLFFLIFGLVRAAFWGGPRWGGGPWMDRRTMLEEWHRNAHTAEGSERRGESGPPRRDT